MSARDRLAEQLAYYRARAPEYDDWWLRRGRYDRGPEASARWRAEAAEVGAALDAIAPHGAALELFFLVDSLHEATSTARDHALAPAAAGVQARRLADGRRFEVVKVYHAPGALTARLARPGFAAALYATPNYFLYGNGRVA